jgi:hypothetical protein
MTPDIVVPLILREMEREQGHWFHALMVLTGANPVPSNFQGTLTEATQYWVDWGRQRFAAQGT